MNIEEAKKKIIILIEENIDEWWATKEDIDALNTLLTAYEKEKRLAEANLKDSEEFQDNMCNHRCILNSKVEELEAELEKEKEKNKELEKNYSLAHEDINWFCENYISKNKIKQIIYPTPENPIPIEVQQSEMYKKLVKEVEE